jgi:hypothetical protein
MQMNTKATEIVSLFSSISIKGLEGVNIGELIATYTFSLDNRLSIKKLFKHTLFCILKCGYKLTTQLHPKYLFCFTNSYGTRKDHLSLFEKVRSLTTGNANINSHYHIRFNIKRVISIFYLFVWIYQTRSTNLSFKIRWHFCNAILLAYMDSNEILSMLSDILSNLRLVVTYCDVHPIDYLLVYRFKHIGIPTATVEHGNFTAGWLFGNSHSDYFLVHGPFAREQAIKSGLKADNVIPVGMMQHIHENIRHHERPRSAVFGIFLNNVVYEKDNSIILGHANKLAKTFNLKYLVRYHPSLNRSNYISILDTSCLSDIDGNKGSIADFAGKIIFAIVGTSTVFIELLRIAVPVFRYPNEDDFYPSITEFNFRSYQELEVLYSTLQKEEEHFRERIMRTNEMLCPTGDAAPRYRAFFDRFT